MDTRDSVVTAHHGGELDLSFGEQGRVLLLNMEDGQAKALSASFTKSWVAGLRPEKRYGLMRLTDAGKIEESFGENGFVVDNFSDDACDTSVVEGIHELPDGKILIMGSLYHPPEFYPAAARYHPDGRLDTSFGVAGKVIIRTAPQSANGASSLQHATNTGSMVALTRVNGSVVFPFNPFANASYLVCLTADGRLDADFGSLGFLELKHDGRPIMVSALGRQPDEKIVVAGNISDATPKGLVCRFDVAGKADEGFADKGVYVLGNLHVGAMSIRADSTIAAHR